MTTRGLDNGQAGFTLIEAVTAMGVFSIAALALMQLMSENVRAQRRITDAFFAGVVADNQLVTYLTAPTAPRVGAQTGEAEQAGRRWPWVATVSQLNEEGVLQITVTVRNDAEPPVEITARTAFRIPE